MADFKIKTTPAPEDLHYFREKKLKPSFSYKDVWGEEHAHAFTVAKSAGFDILEDVRSAVDDAIAKGWTFATFRGKLEPTLRAKGWWGRRTVDDDKTGVNHVAQLGSPRRLKIIYDSNLRAARAAGQWERAQRTKRGLPYFLYGLGPSENHRPHHESKKGLILPVDDPFWDAWYPPNGWGCKCWLRQIGRSEAERLGGVSAPPDVGTVEFVNDRRGTTELIPLGIDPGWHTSPGKGRARGLTNRMSERLLQEGESVARAVIAEHWRNGTALALARVPQRIHIPVGVSQRYQVALGSTSRLIVVSSATVITKVKTHGHHRNLPITPERFALVQSVLDEGDATGFDKRGGYRIWKNIDGLMFRLVLAKSADGFVYVRTFFQSGLAAYGRDKLKR